MINLVYDLTMENMNNIIIPETSIQPNKNSITQETQLPTLQPLIQETFNQNKKKNSIRFYIISLIILLLLSLSCYLLAFRSKDIANLIIKKNTNSYSSFKISNKANLKTSPLKLFISNFNNNTYKVTTTGDISIKGPNKGKDTNWDILFKLNNKVFYTKNGNVLRFDINGSDNISYITDNNLFYSVNYDKKTYRQIDPVKQKTTIDVVYNQMFLLGIILKEDQNGNLLWNNIGNNEWTADWKYITENLPKGANIKIKISIDSSTNLIDSISLKVNTNDSWQDTNYKYEKITNIDELLIIPPNYAKQD